MVIYRLFILASWFVLIVYWVLLAGRAKRGVKGSWRRRWRLEIGLRLVVLILILLTAHFLAAHPAIRAYRQYAVNTNPIAGFLGAALCASGVALAVWARGCLGGNWGMPMSEKINPELIMGGPYAYIRHPIYAGFILAILGSAIGLTIFWAIPLLIGGPYCVYSARQEEKRMTELFPRQYSEYVKRTNMLIPFVL